MLTMESEGTEMNSRVKDLWPFLSQEHQIQTPNIFVQNNLSLGGCLHAISLHHPSVLFLLPTHFVLSNSTIESKMSHSRQMGSKN